LVNQLISMRQNQGLPTRFQLSPDQVCEDRRLPATCGEHLKSALNASGARTFDRRDARLLIWSKLDHGRRSADPRGIDQPAALSACFQRRRAVQLPTGRLRGLDHAR
jgi:hypothetical protein